MCVYVRELSTNEGRRLQRVIRSSPDRIKVRRAQVVLASAQGAKAPDIAQRFFFSPQYVRTIIKRFNDEGFDSLAPRWSAGPARTFCDEQRSLIVETALCPPDLLGCPFQRWSLAKLRDYLIEQKVVVSISQETIRQILRKHRVKLRRTKTWKDCNDPQLASKKRRSGGM
jgi:transposase